MWYWIKLVAAELIRLIAAVYLWQHYVRPILVYTSATAELPLPLLYKGVLSCVGFMILVWLTKVKKPGKKLPPYRL